MNEQLTLDFRCQHRWMIGDARYKEPQPAKCRRCHETRTFPSLDSQLRTIEHQMIVRDIRGEQVETLFDNLIKVG